MLLKQVDRKIGLTKAVAGAFFDVRDPSRITHKLQSMIAQRLYA